MTSINGKRRRIGDDVVYFFIYLCAALSVVLLAGIIIYVFVRGIGQVNWQFLTSETSVFSYNSTCQPIKIHSRHPDLPAHRESGAG